jgi:hypothetical protein
VSIANAPAENAAPRMSGMREPTRPAIRPAIGLTISIAIVLGRRKSPASVTLAPKPKPLVRGNSTSAGISRNELYIPKPIRTVARLTVQTPRLRIMRRSTSG